MSQIITKACKEASIYKQAAVVGSVLVFMFFSQGIAFTNLLSDYKITLFG